MFSRSARYPPELRERAVRLFNDVRPSYKSDLEAIQAVAGILGIEDPDALRKWIRRARARQAPGNHPKRNFLQRLLFRPHTIVAGCIVGVLGGLGLAFSQQLFGIGQPSTVPQSPNLEVDQVALSYATSAGSVTPFQIDIKLLNTGSQLAAINSATLVIQQFTVLPICTTQGGFFSTGTYQGNLPINPSPGQTVNVPISQLVPANGADRFDLLLNADVPRKSPKDLSIYLYRVHVYLTYNVKTKPLDAGEILVNSPSVPSGGQYFWSKSWAARPSYFTFMAGGPSAVPAVKACDIKNSYSLHSMLSLSAMRTTQMSEIEPQLAY